MAGRTKRSGRTSASPGRANIDVGGIAGTFGAGDVGTEAVSEDTIPMEGDVDAKMASGDALRQPLTYLTAQKPSFWQNLLTKGQAGQQYNALQTQFDINRSNQALQQNLAAANQQAAMDRLNAEYQLKGGLDEKQRAAAIAQQNAERQRANQDAQLGAMDVNLTRMRGGLTPFITPQTRGAADFAYGAGNIGTRGFGQSVDQMNNTAYTSQLGQLEDQARIGYAQQNPGLIGQSYEATLKAPISALSLGERRQTESERAGENQRLVNTGQLMNQSEALNRTLTTPNEVGAGIINIPNGFQGTLMGVTPGEKSAAAVITGPDGKPTFGTRAATPPALQALKMPKPAIKLPPLTEVPLSGGVGATPTAQGNPAPQNAQMPQQISTQPVQQPMTAPLTPNISFPNRTNMDQMFEPDAAYARNLGVEGNIVTPETKRKLQLIQTLIGSNLLQTNSNSNAWPPR